MGVAGREGREQKGERERGRKGHTEKLHAVTDLYKPETFYTKGKP